MKPNTKIKKIQTGFTIIELLVVIALMGVSLVIILAGFSQNRTKRSLPLALNETVTNIRKVQSYILSSKNVPNTGLPAKFYSLSFFKSESQYIIRGYDTTYIGRDLETVPLRDTVAVSNLSLTNRDGTVSLPACVQILFAAPFGKMYIDSLKCNGAISSVLQDPAALLADSDATLDIVLTNQKDSSSKTITLYGLTGRISNN